MKYSEFTATMYFLSSVLVLTLMLSSCNKNYISQDQYDARSLEEDLKQIAGSVRTRRSYMKDVAAYKWENNLPIEDKARESVVIQASQNTAAHNGLDSLTTREFFELQIRLAKKVQVYWFCKWGESKEALSGFQDLQKVVRPELIRLGDEIIKNVRIAGLAEYPNSIVKSKKEIFIELIPTEGLSLREKEELFEAILNIKN